MCSHNVRHLIEMTIIKIFLLLVRSKNVKINFNFFLLTNFHSISFNLISFHIITSQSINQIQKWIIWSDMTGEFNWKCIHNAIQRFVRIFIWKEQSYLLKLMQFELFSVNKNFEFFFFWKLWIIFGLYKIC